MYDYYNNAFLDFYKMDLQQRTADWMTAKCSKGSRPRPRKNMNRVSRLVRRKHKRRG